MHRTSIANSADYENKSAYLQGRSSSRNDRQHHEAQRHEKSGGEAKNLLQDAERYFAGSSVVGGPFPIARSSAEGLRSGAVVTDKHRSIEECNSNDARITSKELS